jgi:hypothetical protein
MIGAKNVTSFCVSASAGSGQPSHTHERGLEEVECLRVATATTNVTNMSLSRPRVGMNNP